MISETEFTSNENIRSSADSSASEVPAADDLQDSQESTGFKEAVQADTGQKLQKEDVPEEDVENEDILEEENDEQDEEDDELEDEDDDELEEDSFFSETGKDFFFSLLKTESDIFKEFGKMILKNPVILADFLYLAFPWEKRLSSHEVKEMLDNEDISGMVVSFPDKKGSLAAAIVITLNACPKGWKRNPGLFIIGLAGAGHFECLRCSDNEESCGTD